jgi:hypothetical protein
MVGYEDSAPAQAPVHAGWPTGVFSAIAHKAERSSTPVGDETAQMSVGGVSLAIFYIVIKYAVGGHLISTTDFAIGTATGVATVGAFLTVGPTVLFPRILARRS